MGRVAARPGWLSQQYFDIFPLAPTLNGGEKTGKFHLLVFE